MKRAFAILAIIVIAVSSVLVVFANLWLPKMVEKSPDAFVGVTYCGDSVADGKLLIDKVKDYTNLFILQSGTLQRDFDSVDMLGDYAVSKGMYFLPYFGVIIEPAFSAWLLNATQRWGTRLLGVYYGDEPGGKMLDSYVTFKDAQTGNSITKTTYGDIVVQNPNGTVVDYQLNGNILLAEAVNAGSNSNSSIQTENNDIYATFYPNGTVTATQTNSSTLTNEETPNWSTPTTYQDLISAKPFNSVDDIANRFYANDQSNIQSVKNSTKVFTSDYSMYWFDYMAGYDVVLSQVGWNASFTQEIALERGAAKMQNKDWGIVITWTYDAAPYLANGSEIFSQMKTAYECGAKYLIIFNYYDNQSGPYGSMPTEDFSALQNFWNQVVKNPKEVRGSTQAESALVLPKNYGCGLRWEQDKIWGVILPNETSTQIFKTVQSVLSNKTMSWDIVYDDPNFPLNGKYQQVMYWNQTG